MRQPSEGIQYIDTDQDELTQLKARNADLALELNYTQQQRDRYQEQLESSSDEDKQALTAERARFERLTEENQELADAIATSEETVNALERRIDQLEELYENDTDEDSGVSVSAHPSYLGSRSKLEDAKQSIDHLQREVVKEKTLKNEFYDYSRDLQARLEIEKQQNEALTNQLAFMQPCTTASPESPTSSHTRPAAAKINGVPTFIARLQLKPCNHRSQLLSYPRLLNELEHKHNAEVTRLHKELEEVTATDRETFRLLMQEEKLTRELQAHNAYLLSDNRNFYVENQRFLLQINARAYGDDVAVAESIHAHRLQTVYDELVAYKAAHAE